MVTERGGDARAANLCGRFPPTLANCMGRGEIGGMRVRNAFRWRPRFSLRMLLALTSLVAIVLWYHLHWIDQRREALRTGDVTLVKFHTQPIRAPGLLPLFGERGYSLVVAIAYQGEDWRPKERAAARLFPEARTNAIVHGWER